MNEIASRYAAVADEFTTRVDGAAGKWSDPSPCEGWDARAVVAHVVEVHRGTVAGLAGERPTPVGPDEDPVAAWRAARAAVEAALADPDQAAKVIRSPFGEQPFAQLVGRLVTTDLLVHTWDLARATGQDERLLPDMVEGAFSGLRPMDAMLRSGTAFGPKIDPAPDADVQTQFLNFVGRRV